jgi:hypothetical protein
LHGFDGVFGRKSPHSQSQLSVGCGLDGAPVNAQYVFSGTRTATVHFHKEFGVFHGFSSGLRTIDTNGKQGGNCTKIPNGLVMSLCDYSFSGTQ